MRDYGKLSAAFWVRGSGKRLRGDALGQVVAAYLATAPSANLIGVYYVPLATVAYETGHSVEDIRAALVRIAVAGFAEYDENADLVWVPNHAEIQIGSVMKPGDKRRGAVLAELAKLGSHRFVRDFWSRYGAAYSLGRSPFDAPSKGDTRSAEAPPMVSHDPREEQEQEQEQFNKHHRGVTGPTKFEGVTESVRAQCFTAGVRIPTEGDVVNYRAWHADKGRPVSEEGFVAWMTSARARTESSMRPRSPEALPIADAEAAIVRAYESGTARGKGGPYAMPRAQLPALRDAIRSHARWSETNPRGKPPRSSIEGADLLEWVDAVSEEFAAWLVKQPAEQAGFFSGFGPKGFLRWLNETATKREARRVG